MIRGIGWDTSIEEYLYDDAIRTSRIGIPLGLDRILLGYVLIVCRL